MLRNASKHGLRAVLSLTAIAGLLAVGAPAASAADWSPATDNLGVELKGDVTIQYGQSAPSNKRIHCDDFTLRANTGVLAGDDYLQWPFGMAAGTINTCVNEATGATGTFKMQAIARARTNGGALSLAWANLQYVWAYPSMLGNYMQGAGSPGDYAFNTPWTNGSGSTPSTITFTTPHPWGTHIGNGMYMTGTLAVTQYPTGGLLTLTP